MIKLTKKERQKIIISLITEDEISTQEELVEKLRARGLQVTQATVSRDIKELNISKINNESAFHKYTVSGKVQGENANKLINVFQQALVSIDNAGTLVVVKTLPGMAPASASAIDSFNFDEVTGTIAGDDTIFIATKSPLIAAKLTERIKSLLNSNITRNFKSLKQ